MTEYIDFIGAVLLTVLVIAVVGLIAAGGYVIYKFLKEEL
jgi:hypothetical protein